MKKKYEPANIPAERRWRIEGTNVIDEFYYTPRGILVSVGQDIANGRQPRPLPCDVDRVGQAYAAAMQQLGR